MILQSKENIPQNQQVWNVKVSIIWNHIFTIMFELVFYKITHEHMKQLILSGFQILPNWEKLIILWNNYFINEKIDIAGPHKDSVIQN